MSQSEEQFSDDPVENMRIENELMKLKLAAQYGDAFKMESSDDMTVEMEHQFLKNILAFEASYESGEFITVYERIGKPVYNDIDSLSADQLQLAVKELMELLERHQINLHFSDGPYDDATVYRFITEELFNMEVEKEPIEGMINGFIYEEFHPNHQKEIEKNTHLFLREWFGRAFNDNAWVLSKLLITAAGVQLPREELLRKLRLFMDAFHDFADDGYNIDHISVDLEPGGEQGLGFAEGMLKYDAVMDKNEVIHFEGPYKLYMQMQHNEWEVFYFVMPGFEW